MSGAAAGHGGGGGGGGGGRAIAPAAADDRRCRARRFIGGDLEAAEARFDAARALNPELRPYLWQRGIAKYYLGKFDEAAEQVTARPRPPRPLPRPPPPVGPRASFGRGVSRTERNGGRRR